MSAILICDDSEITTINNYIGTYILRPPCSLTSEKLKVATIRTRHTDVGAKKMEYFPHIETNNTNVTTRRV